MSKYTSLVFEGGGVLGIAYIGALKEFNKNQPISEINNFAGSSIGSLVAAILAFRGDISFIEREYRGLNFAHLMNPDGKTSAQQVFSILLSLGYNSGDVLLTVIREIFKRLCGKSEITFEELNKYGTRLVITGTNVSRGRLELFSAETTPKMDISLAVRISCSYPYVFNPITINGDTYIDGGVTDNYPIRVFDNIEGNSTLGIRLDKTSEIKKSKLPVDNVFNYTRSILETILLSRYDVSEDSDRSVIIDCGEILSMNFFISAEEMKFLVKQGKLAVRKHFTVKKAKTE